MKTFKLVSSLILVGAFASASALAADYGNAKEARAMLDKAVAYVKEWRRRLALARLGAWVRR